MEQGAFLLWTALRTGLPTSTGPQYSFQVTFLKKTKILLLGVTADLVHVSTAHFQRFSIYCLHRSSRAQPSRTPIISMLPQAQGCMAEAAIRLEDRAPAKLQVS